MRPFSMRMISLLSGALLLTWAAGFELGPSDTLQAQQTTPGQTTPNQTTPGQSGDNPDSTAQPQNGISDADAQSLADKEFLRRTLEDGMAEVQYGQLAAQKASGDDVRSLGQKMADNYTKLGNDLSPVAEGAGVKPPAALSKKDSKMVSRLQQLSGSQFDDAYLAATLKDQKRDNDDFSFEAQRAVIPAVKRAAAQGEPVVAADLRMAQGVARSHSLK